MSGLTDKCLSSNYSTKAKVEVCDHCHHYDMFLKQDYISCQGGKVKCRQMKNPLNSAADLDNIFLKLQKLSLEDTLCEYPYDLV